MKVRHVMILFMLLCLLPLFALGEGVSVALTSYEEHEALHEWRLKLHYLLWGSGGEMDYFTFGNETKPSGRSEVSNDLHYRLFAGLTRGKANQLFSHFSKWKSYWVRLQLQVPEGVRVGVENFRFRKAKDDVWVKMVLEEMDSGLGYSWVGDEPMGLEGGEYHLQLMARKGVDLKKALQEAQLVCDVTWHPGTAKARTETVKVQVSRLKEKSYNRKVWIKAVTAERLSQDWALDEVKDTEEFWDCLDDVEGLLNSGEKELWRITAQITKKAGYPLADFFWWGDQVGGGWAHFTESPTDYDYHMNMWPEETEGEVDFFVLADAGISDEEMLKSLRRKEIHFEYATEYVGDLEYDYTPGPKYQVKVDMSKVELTE